MPTYEYACSACQNEWEFEQSIKDAPLTECPRCHEQTAKRQISRGTGFILKGGGWYADLYSSSSNKASSSKSSDSGSGSSSSGSSEGSGGTSSGSSGSSSGGSSSGGSTGGGSTGGDSSSSSKSSAAAA